MVIRPEIQGDADAIRAVTTAAFDGAPHSDGTEVAIVDALRSASALSISLVAVEGDDVVGHIAFSPVQIDGRDGDWFGLGPVSVLPRLQQRGIGRALIEEGLSRLTAMGAGGCVVLGDPGYYGRFGFIAAPDLIYPDVPAEYFQRLAFGDHRPKGVVTYHHGFAAASQGE